MKALFAVSMLIWLFTSDAVRGILVAMHNSLLVVVALLVIGAPSFAASCSAAQAMSAGASELEKRKDLLQRREWLLLEYLSSDGSKKSRRLLELEIEKSKVRTASMLQHFDAVKALATGTQENPDEGTPACDTITRVKSAIDELLDTREKELADFTVKIYPFLQACDEIGVKLANVAISVNKESDAKTVAMVKMSLSIVLGPQTYRAKMSPEVLDKLAAEILAPSVLPPRTLAAYGSLSCLRSHQSARIKPLANATNELARCPTGSWTELGLCIGSATLP